MRKLVIKAAALLLTALIPTLTACSGQEGAVKSDTLYVKKIDNLSEDFIMGCDVSTVISLENSGVKYYDYDGKEADLFEVLKKSGVNYVRVRV